MTPLDSGNRHPAGGDASGTPGMARFANQTVPPERHLAGSPPYMPARYARLCSALDFLHKPWGSRRRPGQPGAGLRRAGQVRARLAAIAALVPVAVLAVQFDPDDLSPLPLLERGEHYAIYDAGVKSYPEATFLVQSSGTPINLGADMLPFMDTTRLRAFIEANDVPLKADAPREVYLYNWVDGAQGALVFDVGVLVEDRIADVAPETGFVVKRYPAMKFASLVYEGAFPHEEGTGWHRIRWEERAKAAGHIYTERLYRELYHRYDFANVPHRHVTEIQIEIE